MVYEFTGALFRRRLVDGAVRGDIVRETIEIVREVAKRRAAKYSGRWHARWLSAHPAPVGQICFVSCLCSEETDWISDESRRWEAEALENEGGTPFHSG